ncbi:hypothetical protein Tco_1550842 [Tanacetum coccineum]
MTPAEGIKAINELSKHSLSWYKEGDIVAEDKELKTILNHISSFEDNMNIITEEVRMVQHKYEIPIEGRISNLEETIDRFIKESLKRHKKVKIWFGESRKVREAGSLPSSTETNLRGLAHAITTRSGLNYKPPKNPLEDNTNTQNKPETTIRNKEEAHDDKRNTVESHIPPIPFPGRLKKEK